MAVFAAECKSSYEALVWWVKGLEEIFMSSNSIRVTLPPSMLFADSVSMAHYISGKTNYRGHTGATLTLKGL